MCVTPLECDPGTNCVFFLTTSLVPKCHPGSNQKYHLRVMTVVFLHLPGLVFALQQATSLHSQHSSIQSFGKWVDEGDVSCVLLLHLDAVPSFDLWKR